VSLESLVLSAGSRGNESIFQSGSMPLTVRPSDTNGVVAAAVKLSHSLTLKYRRLTITLVEGYSHFKSWVDRRLRVIR
jgi:hypothetical protein